MAEEGAGAAEPPLLAEPHCRSMGDEGRGFRPTSRMPRHCVPSVGYPSQRAENPLASLPILTFLPLN